MLGSWFADIVFKNVAHDREISMSGKLGERVRRRLAAGFSISSI